VIRVVAILASQAAALRERLVADQRQHDKCEEKPRAHGVALRTATRGYTKELTPGLRKNKYLSHVPRAQPPSSQAIVAGGRLTDVKFL
jgi:hypothetical protein